MTGSAYAVAARARRSLHVETWMFTHPSWINWNTAAYTGPLARQALDGYVLVVVPDSKGNGLDDAVRAGRAIRDAGMKIVPGIRLGPVSYIGWFEPPLWAAGLIRANELAKVMAPLGAEPALVIDLEPYWDAEPRYPGADLACRLFAAMQSSVTGWIQFFADHEAWLLPWGPDYWSTLMMALVASRGRHTSGLDEATYALVNWPGDELAALLRLRSAPCLFAGVDYVPGFFLRSIGKQTLYPAMRSAGIRRCWFYADASEDDYSRWGLEEWQWNAARQ